MSIINEISQKSAIITNIGLLIFFGWIILGTNLSIIVKVGSGIAFLGTTMYFLRRT